MFCGFAIRSREIVICYGLGGLQIPWFDRSNLFFTTDFKSVGTPNGALAYQLLCARPTPVVQVDISWWADFKSVGTARAEAPREMCHVRTNTP